MFINDIPKDKLLHFFYGALSAFVFIGVCLFFNINLWYSFLAQVLLWGIGKEIIHDKLMKRGNAEWLDFGFSMLPYILTIYILK